MKNITVPMLLLWITACGGPGGGTDASAPNLAPGPGATPIAAKLVSGRSFDCLQVENEVYCAGTAADIVSSPTFTLFASFAAAPTRIESFDDTLCLTATVLERPIAATPGTATYCWGEASLGVNYISYPLVYGGPQFTAMDISSDTTFSALPFVGGDLGMGVFTDEGGTWLVMQDPRTLASAETLSCTTLAGIVTCPYGIEVDTN